MCVLQRGVRMAKDLISPELLCVLTEIGFDKKQAKQHPHEIIKAHAAVQVRDYMRMILLKLKQSNRVRDERVFEDLADVLALVKS